MSEKKEWHEETSPFHAGEQAIQERLGLRDNAERLGRKVIRPFLPEQHRDFYANLPFLVVGSVDEQGWPWASLLAGKPGFISSPDSQSLMVDAAPQPGDPLVHAIVPGAPLGLLGIALDSRRRNRVNVHVSTTGKGCFGLAVDQSFGNCPQYIQTRDIEFKRDPQQPVVIDETDRFSTLDEAASDMIQMADTLFVSSYVEAGANANIEGVDVSHRGGRPGFVKVEGNTLTVPDYAGNSHFNTLGNFVANPKAGLTFVDFETGDLLMLTGTVEIIWDDDPQVRAFRGAERAWRFTLDHGIRLSEALPMRWSFGEFSPNALITGDWDEAAATLAAETKRDAWRDYRIVRIDDESDVIRSFYLEPADGDGLISYDPGQFLTIRVRPEGAAKPIVRTYTLSSAPADKLYRISIKREGAAAVDVAPGLVSNHLHDILAPGDIVEACAPRGDFTLDTAEERPAVLLAGGVGITPMISMARQVAHEGLRTRHVRPLTIFHSAQTTGQRAFFEAFRALERSTGGAIRYVSLVDAAEDGERPGYDFNGVGYITAALLREVLALDDYDFYLCGPAGFMQAVYNALRKLGARDARIFAEAFGPAALERQPDEGTPEKTGPVEVAGHSVVTFAESGFEQSWTNGDGSLLELAEAHGLAPEYGCRSGTCGTCAAKLLAGKVTYLTEPTAAHAEDEALICCAVPAAGSDALKLAL